MKRGERTKEEPLVRDPKRKDKVRGVTFPVEQEAPAQASEATATATSSSSAWVAICISSVKLVQVQMLVCQYGSDLALLVRKGGHGDHRRYCPSEAREQDSEDTFAWPSMIA